MTYEIKRLDIWPKFKEYNERCYQNMQTTKERGQLLTGGMALGLDSIGAGVDAIPLPPEPYSAMCGWNPKLARELSEAAEQRGFREVCPYMKTFLGAMYLDRGYLGKFPKPDFSMRMVECCTHAKWFEAVSEYLNIPEFYFDQVAWEGQMREHHLKYFVSQCHEYVDWLEKTFHRKWSEEKFKIAWRNSRRSRLLFSQVCELQKTVPAPLDVKTLYTLMVPCINVNIMEESVKLYEALLDEVKDRVAKGIAASPEEKVRLVGNYPPPWHHIGDVRYGEEYGAIWVASNYVFHMGLGWKELPDGSIGTPAWVETEPRNLDEAFWQIGEDIFGHPWRNEAMIGVISKIASEFHIHGVILQRNRGCEWSVIGGEIIKLALEEKGIPVLAFESNMSDPDEYSESQTRDRMDSFYERLGLHPQKRIRQ